jgi:hypothetical protein
MCARIRSCFGLAFSELASSGRAWLSAALMVCVLLGPGPARADAKGPPWLRIERVEALPSVIAGHAQLRLHVSVVDLQGVFLDDVVGDSAWTLTIANKTQRIPYIAGNFEGVEDELAVAVVIAATPGFADVLPDIKRHVAAFIEALPRKRTQVAVIDYSDEVHGSRRARPVPRALKELEDIEAGVDPGKEALLDAMERARAALARTRPSEPGAALRRMIVVISDGRDRDYPNPENYRTISKRAGREGIPIHSIAFAPDSNRLPLRGLGELSKLSGGTFRFAYTASGFGNHFEQLGKEVLRQYVLTFYVPQDEVLGKRVGLVAAARGLESTDTVRVPKLVCGQGTCDSGQYCAAGRCVTRKGDSSRGVLGWILLVGGVLIGLVLLFVVLSLILAGLQQRRGNAALLAAAAAQAAHADAAAGAPAGPHRIAAQGPGGGMVQPSAPRGHAASHGQSAPASGAYQQIPPTGQHHQIPPTGQHHQIPPTGQHQRLQPIGAHPGAGYAPAQPSLLVLQGPLQGQRVPLHHGFLIGKAPNCHLVLAGDNYASGHHAQILMDTRGGCTLVDQGSTNGTFVNGVRTTEKRLSHGMLIRVGSTEARFLAQ